MISGYAIYPCAGAFIVVGCYVTMIGIRMCKEARVTWTWPSTEGIVQEVGNSISARGYIRVFG